MLGVDKKSLRLAGWTGIVFSVLSLIVLPLVQTAPPALGSSAEAFLTWYGDHQWGFLIGNYLGIAAFIPGFVQLAILTAVVRRREGEGGAFSWLVLGSGGFTYAVFACSLCVFQTLPLLSEDNRGTMVAMGTLANVWFALDGIVALSFVLAVGWATARLEIFPRWFLGASWVTGILLFFMSLGPFASMPAWLIAGGTMTLIGFCVFFFWTLALSVIFLKLEPPAAAAALPAPAEPSAPAA